MTWTGGFIILYEKKVSVLNLNSGQVGQPGRSGQVVFSDSLKKIKCVNFDFIQWPSWTTRQTSGLISLIEKK